MAFHPFEVDATHLVYTILGGFIVLFGMFSLFVKERLFIGEAVIATLVGIIAGPYVTNGFDPRGWGGGSHEVVNDITLEVTRVVIAISVFAVGVELPKAYMRKHWKSVALLLGPVMVFGWFVSAALIYGLIPGLSFLSALVIAACVTPTDPILAQAVIGGKFADKHVPAHLRHLLAAESGCNDGAAFPFLYIALYLTLDASDAHAVGEWFYVTWLYEVALGIVIGAIVGFVARKTMKFCERKNLVDRQSFVAQYISLAILTIGITTLLGSDDLLAAFACGTAFAWDGFFNKQTEESYFSNVIDLLFNVTAFIYIGAILPFAEFANSDLTLSVWRLVVLMICIFVLRRLPIILAVYKWVPDIHTLREALFVGHFGPIGVGAIFISTLAASKLPEPHSPPENQVELLAASIQPIVHFFVLCSVLIHGLSIPFFSLGRRVHSISRTHSIMLTRTETRMSGLSRDTRRPEPAWLSGVNRIIPGQIIRINRDDDGDLEKGPMDREDDELTPEEKAEMEDAERDRLERGEGSSSSGSSTAVKPPTKSERSSNPEDRHEAIKSNMKEIAAEDHGIRAEDAHEEAKEEVEGDEEQENESMEERQLESDGRRTPPIREFREGNHLIIERRKKEDGDVHVEVIRNRFAKDKDEKAYPFSGPRDDVKIEVHNFVAGLKDDVEELEESFVDGFMHLIRETPDHEAKRLREREQEKEKKPRRSEEKGRQGEEADWSSEGEDEDNLDDTAHQRPTNGLHHNPSSSSHSRSNKAPAIFIHASRPSSRKSATSALRKKLLRSSSSKSPDRSPASSAPNTPPGSPPVQASPSLLAPTSGGKSRTFSSSSAKRPLNLDTSTALGRVPSIRFTDSPLATPSGTVPPSPSSTTSRLASLSPMTRASDPTSLLLNPLSQDGEDTSQTFTTASMAENNPLSPSVSFNIPERPT